jgi:N-acetylneuraminic acid mutarotase
MKNKKFLLGLLSLSLFAFAAWSCSDDEENELVGNWVKASDFGGSARNAAVTFNINNTAYVATGYGTVGGSGSTTKTSLKDLWMFDPATNGGKGSWTRKADMPAEAAARNNGVAFSIGTTGYVGLGSSSDNESKMLKDFWKYESTTDTWTKLKDFGAGSARPELATPRVGAIAFTVNGFGYVGFCNDGGKLQDLWKYNPADDSWTQVTGPGGSKREGAAVFVIDNTAYVVGGTNNNATVTDFWAYNAATDSWSEKRKVANVSTETYDDNYGSIARTYGVAFVMDGKGYLTAGASSTTTTWEYDSTAAQWTERTRFEGNPRLQAVGFAVNNRGFVGLGAASTGGAPYDNMYEFHPREKYDELDTRD